MSVNREHVVWQSENGSWSIGFWDYYNVNEDSDDFDYEWDVEYTDEFNWVSRGHATEEEAHEAWNGPNPGGGEVYEFNEHNAKDCARFDAKADEYLAKNRGLR